MSAFDFILHAGEGRRFKKIVDLARTVSNWEGEMETLSDEELAAKTAEFRQRIDNGEELDALLGEAYAAVREAAKRTIGQRHYDVQVIGATILHKGAIAEMKTGEGKTLVATMPTYLNALSGKGVHVATVNPYLAKRDAEWMGQIYRFLGMSVGLIQPDMSMAVRRGNYNADVTYGTNNEFGFDYLRDNMAMRLEDCSQRGHYFAVVDEVDSILIDEARTPLIISGAADEAARWYRTFARLVQRLKPEEHYEVDEAKRTIAVTEEGIARVEQLLSIDNLYDQVHTPLVHYLESALKAKELYKRDRDYIVQNREVLIVDEFTGRTLPGRRWSDGLHQAVEAKESVPIQQENQTLATITIQNYFRLYEKLAGMTGTAKTQATEFANVYGLEVFEVPTNRPNVRKDEPDSIYKSEDAKWKAVTDDVVSRHEAGQPVLVGTISIEKSERLAGYLARRGVEHHILNAKHHEKEAYIVAQAGRTGAVTLATNMAGRGVDILLGGNPEYLARAEMSARGWDNDAYLLEQLSEEDRAAYEAEYEPLLEAKKAECAEEHERVVDAGGLYILGTERHESRRIDNQLRGRAGRQGDPGATRFYLSLDDDLMRFFATGMISTVMERLNLPEDMPIESKMVSKAIERAQSQVEGQNYELRKNVLKYDEVMNRQREVVYEQRRQLLEGADLSEKALEFVAETVESVIGTYANADSLPEEWDWEGLEAAMAQLYPTQLVGTFDKEATNYPALLDAYQEEALAYYHQREEEVMAGWVPNQPLDSMPAAPSSLLPAGDGVPDYYEVLGIESDAEIADIRTAFNRRLKETHPDLNPGVDEARVIEVITAKEVLSDDDRREEYDTLRSAEGSVAEGAALAPIDFSVLASSYELFRRRERMRELERLVFISILDNKWREHLYEMDYLREGIGLRGYGQRDPEMEYKREGYDMFQAMMTATKEEFVRYMFHVQMVEPVQDQPVPVKATREAPPAMEAGPVDASGIAAASGTPSSANGANGQAASSKPAPARVTASVGGGPAPASGEFEKVGRNAPCPCGSGRKYKKCHGAEV